MQLEWWHWAVAGIILILAELAVPAFVLVWFGLGALIVALLAALAAVSVTAQLAAWLVVSLLLVFLWFKVFRPESHRTRVGMSAPAMIGEVGLLAHDVAPFEKGEVRFQKPLLGTDSWPCIADEEIAAGTRVKVVAVEGSLLKVGRTS
ncbi:MAG: NfeD family protein [Rhodocyclales bacterium]|jgi:membrane protein implicated in regulation of membrane protease activity|nr:NfeD family protein [Rhodocyclales bacterium]